MIQASHDITTCTLHPTPCTLHPTPYTLHPAPYTLHSTPYNLHPTPYTLHPTPYTLHPTPYTLYVGGSDLLIAAACQDLGVLLWRERNSSDRVLRAAKF